jgi:hypothetical protein
LKNVLENVTRAQVMEHFGVGTCEQGLKFGDEKEVLKGSGPWGLGGPDH